MIPKDATGEAASLPFDLLDAAGEWVSSYVWNDLGGGITDDFLVRLPDTGSGSAYANTTIARLKQHGDGFGHYELDSATAETAVVGKVYYRWLPSAALAIADQVVTLDAGNDVINWGAHDRKTGDGPIQLTTSGSLAGTGVAIATNYWLVRRDAGTLALATSKANAINNVVIDITGAGTGVHTLVDTVATRQVLWDYETSVRWEDIVNVWSSVAEPNADPKARTYEQRERIAFSAIAGKAPQDLNASPYYFRNNPGGADTKDRAAFTMVAGVRTPTNLDGDL